MESVLELGAAKRGARLASKGFGRLFVWVWVLFSLAMLAWLILAAFKRNNTVFRDLWALPDSNELQNFSDAWDLLNLAQTTLNSLLTVGGGTALTMAVAAPAAYALTRMRFRGASPMVSFFALGIGVPVHAIIIPLFVGLSEVNLTNSLWGLTLTYMGVSMPFAVFLMTGFFRSLPSELEEAAVVEGASPLRVFSVMLPLARPGMVASALIVAVGLWNEFLLALVLTYDEGKRTIGVGLLNTFGAMRYTSNWVGLFASVVIMLTPLIILYTWLSRRIIEGLTVGATK
ncbi:MAG: carbohydrate ABC transporter permease [bacterium]|nr:carbohydrate ABC transporter permease [bacterium]MCY4162789.1 carbohydrate ABC transporter permease [bacterium]MCY4257033.1 carbohydrate ABC transporter permease [bacterium]